MISKDKFIEKIKDMSKENLEKRLIDIYFLTEEYLKHNYSELNMCGEDLMDILESNHERYYLPEKYNKSNLLSHSEE